MVSVIIPVRNEAAFIASTLDALLAQDYPRERLEIIVADGGSDDGTREIIAQYASRYPFIRLIDNPERVTPNGLNRAISAARGDIISRVDGHCCVAADFVSQNVRLFEEHPEAWVVGGPIIHAGQSPRGTAAAIAMGHPLGVGMARHRFAAFEGYVDTVQFPAFRRWVFDRVGTFDTTLIRTEDDELNYRILQAGGKLFVSPRVQYVYFVRDRFGALFRQYFQYSFWRIPVMRKHGKPTTIRQIVPLAFFALMGLMGIIGLLFGAPLVAAALPTAYVAALSLCAVSLVASDGPRIAGLSVLAMMTMHLAYAGGLAAGMLAYLFRIEAWDNDGRMSRLTR